MEDTRGSDERVSPAFESYNFDARWWTAPTDKIEARLAKATDNANDFAILVTTGAFCPIHKGHVQMLETAKRELESRGMTVLGGYICPDHDEYVSSKLGDGCLSAAERLELCEMAVEDSDWLMVDRWAAIYAPSFVGFTTIVSHVDKMVKHCIRSPTPIRVVYACGGDNAMFAFEFTARGSCVCVLRPGSLDCFKEMAGYEALRRSPRIIFSDDITAPLDSTSIRKGDLSGLLPTVRKRWLAMQQAKAWSFLKSDSVTAPVVVCLRNEGLWALEGFTKRANSSSERLQRAYKTFSEELQNMIELAYDAVRTEASPYKIVPIHLKDQWAAFQHALDTHGRVISLDPCLLGTYNLHLPPVYKPLVKSPSGCIAAPGSASLIQQTTQVETGAYAVFSERLPLDISIRQLTEHFSEGFTITTHLSPTDLNTSKNEGDIKTKSPSIQGSLNARDFLAGSREGGTVLQLGETEFVRAPNIIPYVRPAHRAHVDVTVEMGFSNAVWELNLGFFQDVGGDLLVQDMAPGFQALCKSQGFPADMHMTELCEWHLAAFEDMTFHKL